jgi:F-type H+-transporting ATPase subunit alpha
VKEIKAFRKDLMDYFELKHPEIIEEIDTQKQLPEDLIERILTATKEFKGK